MNIEIGSKYIYARRWGLTAEATNYEIINRKSETTLGYVEYYKPWRCQVFQPNENTEYSADCLRDIADFIITNSSPNRRRRKEGYEQARREAIQELEGLINAKDDYYRLIIKQIFEFIEYNYYVICGETGFEGIEILPDEWQALKAKWLKRNSVSLGDKGVRDPEYPCSEFDPSPRTLQDPVAHCDSDGHYLCKECKWLKEKDDEN